MRALRPEYEQQRDQQEHEALSEAGHRIGQPRSQQHLGQAEHETAQHRASQASQTAISAASTPLSMGVMPALGTVFPALMSQNAGDAGQEAGEGEGTPDHRVGAHSHERAVSKSAAAARRARPNMVRCTSQLVASRVTSVTPITTVSNTSMCSEPTL